MKKIILLLIICCTSFLLPIYDVKAVDGYIGFLDAIIPRNSNDNWYSGLNYVKTEDSVQTYESYTAYTDDLFQNERDIMVRTWDGTTNSNWITLSAGERKNWGLGNSSGGNVFRGTYAVDIKRVSSGTSNLVHHGCWWLNASLIP